MKATLRWLLSELFDYAGLFPPAQLPLADALRNYLEYRRSADAWMLGGFVCPSSMLFELRLLENALPVCVVVQPVHVEEILLAEIRRAVAEHSGRTRIRSLEMRIPANGIHCLWDKIASLVPPEVPVFFEAPPDETLEQRVLGPMAASGRLLGFKLRCGGQTAAAVPTSAQVVRILAACHRLRIPLKLTAGLHHPIRRLDASIQSDNHGFLNILLADLLLRSGKIGLEGAEVLLEDKETGHFFFSEDSCGWQGYALALSDLEKLGRNIVSIGSCSFDEPRDDLRSLGWL